MENSATLLFSTIPDARVVNRCTHKLMDIVFIAFCTLLCNGEDFEDAVGCQVAIGEQIQQQGADYLLAVKDNQADLLEEVQEAFQHSLVQEHEENWEYDHGRYEHRHGEVLDAQQALSPALLEKWIGVQRLVKISATRQVQGQTTLEQRYYISSYTQADAGRFNDLVRGHWGLENHLHWHLDVTFAEDASRARTGNAL